MVETNTGEKDDGDQPRDVTETVGKRIYKLLHQSEAWLWLTAGVLYNIGWTFVAINFVRDRGLTQRKLFFKNTCCQLNCNLR